MKKRETLKRKTTRKKIIGIRQRKNKKIKALAKVGKTKKTDKEWKRNRNIKKEKGIIKEQSVKVASILMYFMLKQLAHFLQNILADLLYKIRHRLIRKCYGYFSCP